jgi:hypothetical protein
MSKTKKLSFRATESEARNYLALAVNKEMTLSDYIRFLLDREHNKTLKG